MADTRISAMATIYDRDTIDPDGDYVMVDRSGGSSGRILVEEAVLAALERASGNVGIGTTSPDSQLHAYSTTDGSVVIKAESAVTNSFPFFSLKNDVREWRIYADGSSLSDGFGIYDAGASAYRVVVNTSGNVGIGTTSPESALHLYKSGADWVNLKIERSAANLAATVNFLAQSAASGTPDWFVGKDHRDTGDADFRIWRYTGSHQTADLTIDETGKVGIGTTSPAVHLHVNKASSDTAIKVQRADQSSGGYSLTHASSVSTYSDLFSLSTDSANGTFLLFGSGAYVMDLVMLDGTITSNHIVARVDDTYDVGSASYRFDDVYATNGTIQTSDARMKSDIADSDLGLEFIQSLRPVSFKRDSGKRTHYGLIAQEVEAALAGRDFAGLIYDKDSDRYGMRYDELIAPLIAAVQQLTQRVESLEQGE